MKRLYALLRRPFFYRIFVWMLEHVTFVFPVERLRETATLLAFVHPKPSYPFHALLVPKKSIRSLAELDPADPFLVDMIAAAQSLVAERQFPAYRLIVNGGEYQEFPHLHFHLISDTGAIRPSPRQEK